MEKVVQMLFWLHFQRELSEWGKGEKKSKDKISIISLFSFLGCWTFFPPSNLDKFWNYMSFWNMVKTLLFDSSNFFILLVTIIRHMWPGFTGCLILLESWGFFPNNLLFTSVICVYYQLAFSSLASFMICSSKASPNHHVKDILQNSWQTQLPDQRFMEGWSSSLGQRLSLVHLPQQWLTSLFLYGSRARCSLLSEAFSEQYLVVGSSHQLPCSLKNLVQVGFRKLLWKKLELLFLGSFVEPLKLLLTTTVVNS